MGVEALKFFLDYPQLFSAFVAGKLSETHLGVLRIMIDQVLDIDCKRISLLIRLV